MSECNSVECNFTELTYYHRNRAVVLNRAKANYENYKGRLREQARDKYRNISEEVKIKRENMEKNRYRNMYQEKKKDSKNIKKIIVRLKSLNVIINKIVF